jgi:hypothetical protein
MCVFFFFFFLWTYLTFIQDRKRSSRGSRTFTIITLKKTQKKTIQ